MTVSRRPTRLWLILMCCAIAALGLHQYDRVLKNTNSMGYIPDTADWVVHSPDLGQFLEAVGETPTYPKLETHLARQLRELALFGRQQTGVRFTPTRWGRWCGQGILAASSPEGVGLCLRPGLLLRWWSFYITTWKRLPEIEGIHSAEKISFAWREGFLLISTSPKYLRAALASREPLPLDETSATGPPTLDVSCRFPPEWNIRIKAEAGLPFTGWGAFPMSSANASSLIVTNYPNSPLFSIAGNDSQSFANALLALIPDSIDPALSANVLRELNFIPLSTDRPFTLHLTDIDLSEPFPLPEFIAILSDTPLPAIPEDAIEHSWEEHTGWVLPRLGELYTLSMAQRGGDLYLASQEPTLARALSQPTDQSEMDADFFAALDWAKFGDSLEKVLRIVADHEGLPRMNTDDLEELWLPYLAPLAALGRLEFTVHGDERGARINGALTVSRETAS